MKAEEATSRNNSAIYVENPRYPHFGVEVKDHLSLTKSVQLSSFTYLISCRLTIFSKITTTTNTKKKNPVAFHSFSTFIQLLSPLQQDKNVDKSRIQIKKKFPCHEQLQIMAHNNTSKFIHYIFISEKHFQAFPLQIHLSFSCITVDTSDESENTEPKKFESCRNSSTTSYTIRTDIYNSWAQVFNESEYLIIQFLFLLISGHLCTK